MLMWKNNGLDWTSTSFSPFRFAAKLIAGVLDFKTMIDQWVLSAKLPSCHWPQLQAVTVLNLVFAAVRRCRWRTWGGSRCVWTSTTRWCRPAASPARRETLWWTTPRAPRPLNTSPSCTTARWAARTHLGYLLCGALQILLNSVVLSSLVYSTLV